MSDLVAPWQIDEAITLWNTHAAKALGWRVYTDGKAGSRPRSIKRLSIILDRAGYSFERFSAELLVALIHIQEQGVEVVNAKLNAHYGIRITFWTFVRDLDNIHALSNQALGRDPAAEDQDKARRDAKATLLRDFQGEVTAWVEQMAYRSGDDNGKLTAALAAARRALAIAEDELSC